MKQLKSFVLAIAAAFLLIGSIGVVALSCFCENDGVTISFFVSERTHHASNANDNAEQFSSTCCTHKCGTAATQGNCHAKHSSKKGCSQNAIQHIKVKLDFFSKHDIHPILALEFHPEKIVTPLDTEAKLNTIKQHINAPPPLGGRERLLQKQHWLI